MCSRVGRMAGGEAPGRSHKQTNRQTDSKKEGRKERRKDRRDGDTRTHTHVRIQKRTGAKLRGCTRVARWQSL